MKLIEKEAKSLLPFSLNRHFMSSARAGMAHILKFNMLKSSKGILLPSYIGISKIEGSGVFDPVIFTGMKYEFYHLDKNLSPDLNDIENHLRSGKYQLIFLVHYFGFIQTDINKFVDLCHRYNVRVIEDCAHVPPILNKKGYCLGENGDYAIFSIHKSIGTDDGGFFLDRTGETDVSAIPNEDRINQDTLEKYINTEIDKASKARLLNYQKVSKWVKGFEEIKLMYDQLPQGLCPLNCPIIVSKGMREKLYFKLIEKGILPTALYHTLINQIERDKFRDSYFVSENILNLPTHPDISSDHLEKYHDGLSLSVKEVFQNEY